MWCIHQYRVCIINKPGPDLYKVNWLFKNNCTENRDQHISRYTSMHINRRHIGSNQRECRPLKSKIIHNTRLATQKDEVEQSMKHYWPIRSELAIINDIAMKGRTMIIPFLLQRQTLKLFHGNNMVIKMVRLLVMDLVYWVNMTADIEMA